MYKIYFPGYFYVFDNKEKKDIFTADSRYLKQKEAMLKIQCISIDKLLFRC